MKKLLGLIGFISLVAMPAAWGQEFGYANESGPPNWDQLSGDWKACRAGKIQSPIVIQSASAKAGENTPLLFNYGVVNLNVKNTGHSVQADVLTGVPTLTVGTRVFQLQQFHFHTPSEHWVDGENRPMEMHFVHKDSIDGTNAVVAVFLTVGAVNAELDKIWSNGLPIKEGDTESVSEFNLSNVIPEQLQTYRYTGSLTTPPCTEQVRWFVLAEGMEVSQPQLSAYQSIFSGKNFPDGNARPVRLSNQRPVSISIPQWK